MVLKKGMYVRTDTGIGKYIDYNEIEFGNLKCKATYRQISKASHNLLGNDKEPCLIEPGDYVNGKKVKYVGVDSYGIGYLVMEHEQYLEEDIETIVTKEQFESMSYKVEE